MENQIQSGSPSGAADLFSVFGRKMNEFLLVHRVIGISATEIEDIARAQIGKPMEDILRVSIAYDEARFRRIRHACFGEIPEGMAGQPKEWIESVLETDEETTGEEFRKLRDAALGIPENAEGHGRGE